jgi:hypothetical protein
MRVLFRLGTLGGQHLYAKGGSCNALIFASITQIFAVSEPHPASKLSPARKKRQALLLHTAGIKLKAE